MDDQMLDYLAELARDQYDAEQRAEHEAAEAAEYELEQSISKNKNQDQFIEFSAEWEPKDA